VKLAGIRFVLQEESYTSGASFLDGDPNPTYGVKQEDKHAFTGTRGKRGLCRAHPQCRCQRRIEHLEESGP
jgi:putative transposase